MNHRVRRTLLSLGCGVAVQRGAQLLAFVLVAHALGVVGIGTWAAGQSLAALLAIVASAGVRNLAAREVAQRPEAARALLAEAIRKRLGSGGFLLAIATTAAFAGTQHPWFWVLSALQVVPAAFDLKNLIDVTGRTRTEVLLESSAGLLQLLLVACWVSLGGRELTTLAAIALVCRVIYALGALRTLRRLPADPGGIAATPRLPTVRTGLAAAQIGHELLAAADVLGIALVAGDAVAGHYAVAARFAQAALLPSQQLARLLLPHLLHSARGGDPSRTMATALRATLWLTLPMCAGGLVVAESLCALGGADLGASGDALRALLVAGVCQHVGWQCSHALLAAGRDRGYTRGLGVPSLLHAALLAGLMLAGERISAGEAPATVAMLAALAAAMAHAAYAGGGLWQLGRGADLARALPGPLLAAAATAAATALPCQNLALQLGAGAGAFALVLWCCELRGRTRRVGDGLSAASGFVD